MNTLPAVYVAMADDHVAIAQAIADQMKYCMDHVEVMIIAKHGKDLLEQLARAPHLPDICTLDISMPVMDGYDTAQALQKDYPAIKTIVLSMYDTDYTVRRMLSYGVCGFIAKTAGPQEWSQAINDMRVRGYYYSSEIIKRYPKLAQNNRDAYKCNPFNRPQTQFLKLAITGLSYEQIANKMCVSVKTVQHYADQLAIKTGLHSRHELVRYVMESGLG